MSRKGIVKDGGRGNDLIKGTDRDDRLSGGNGNDQLYGGAGDDRLDGDGGNDLLDGGSGSDRVDGGSGNDVLVYVARENRNSRDDYDGGSGSDTLRLVLTREEWMRNAVQSDIANYLNFVDKHTNRKGEADGHTFRFSAFDLKATKLEKLEVVVDGTSLNPRDQAVDARNDTARVGEDDARVTGNVLTGAGADLAPDLVRSIQLIAGPAGGSITKDAAGKYTYAGAGHGTLTLDAAGAFVYAPGTVFNSLNLGQTATETFSYRLTDADGDTDVATITITIVGANDGIRGTPGADTLNGTTGNDEIYGLGGNDTIDGLGGNDLLDGGDGDDTLRDSSGNNRFLGGNGNDTVDAVGPGTADVDGGAGDDHITVQGPSGRVIGGTGNDFMMVFGGVYAIDGGEGDDIAYGLNESGNGEYTIRMGAGIDAVTMGGKGTVDLGAGNDIYGDTVGASQVTLTTGPGQDYIAPVFGRTEPLVITDFTAGEGGDYFHIGTALRNTGWDGVGNPFAQGYLRLVQVGTTTVLEIDNDGLGGPLAYTPLVNLQNVTRAAITNRSFNEGFDPHEAVIPAIIGTAGDDNLVGNDGPNQMAGLGGNDTLDGGLGNDTMFGGDGDDRLFDSAGNNRYIGGAGNDTLNYFSFSYADTAFMDGGEGDDYISGAGLLSAVMHGGSGADSVNVYDSVYADIFLGEGNDFSRISVTTSGSLFAGAGDDNVYVDGGLVLAFLEEGNDVVNLTYTGQEQFVQSGAGRDQIVPNSFGVRGLVINDFTPGPDGDLLALGYLMQMTNWDGVTNPYATGHLRLTQDGSDTLVELDLDGSAGAGSAVTAIVLQSLNVLSLTATNIAPFFDLGGSPDVTLIGSFEMDGLYAGPGNDRLEGRGGDDFLHGFAGNDYMEDHEGANHFWGYEGDDTIVSHGASRATVDAGDGRNTIDVRNVGYVQITAGSGDDQIVVAQSGDITIEAHDGDNRIQVIDATGFSHVCSGSGADYMALDGAAQFDSGAGDDELRLDGAVNGGAGVGDDRVVLLAPGSLGSVGLGTGNDRLVVENVAPGAGYVFEFNPGAGGDVLDMSAVIVGTLTSANVSQYLGLRNDSFGFNTIVSWDVDGAGSAHAPVDLLLLANVSGLNVADFYTNGNLVV